MKPMTRFITFMRAKGIRLEAKDSKKGKAENKRHELKGIVNITAGVKQQKAKLGGRIKRQKAIC